MSISWKYIKASVMIKCFARSQNASPSKVPESLKESMRDKIESSRVKTHESRNSKRPNNYVISVVIITFIRPL
jgi:hypothetical protein